MGSGVRFNQYHNVTINIGNLPTYVILLILYKLYTSPRPNRFARAAERTFVSWLNIAELVMFTSLSLMADR